MPLVEASVPWWYRTNAKKALESWIRPLITPRPYTLRYSVGEGSYMDFRSQEIVIDPTAWDFLNVAAYLPLVWNGKQVNTLAQLQWRFARTAARHEAMHVLFSVPPECHGVLHFLVNALEDEWIEQLARFYYPAAWGDFVFRARLVAQYYPLPDPEECEREHLMLNMCLYHRFDWKRPKGTASRYRFQTEEDEQFWHEKIQPLVERAWSINEYAKRKDIACEILDVLDIPESAPLPKHGLLMNVNPLDIEGERGEDDRALSTSMVIFGTSSNDGDEHGREEKKAEDNDSGEEQQDDGGISINHTERADAEKLPYPALVHLVSDNDEVPSPLSAADELYLLPSLYLENLVRSEKSRLLRVLLAKTPDAGEDISPAGGEFDVEAYIRSDGARPFRFINDEAPGHEGLAIALLIDATTSMGGWPGEGIDDKGVFQPEFYSPQYRMTYAAQVAMLFELVCPPAGITLLIGAAGDDGTLYHLPGEYKERYKPSQPVTWLRHRHTPPDSELTRAAIAGLYGKYGSERISASLAEAQRELAACRAGTKLIIYIHDGMPTDERPSTIVSLLKDIRRKGTLVVAPFVGEQSDIALLSALFGAQWTLPIERLPDLSKRLGRLLVKYARKERS